jgi:NADH-quinone oxidoreductase subunit M
MSKMGLYGFLAILVPLFPAQLHAMAPVLVWLALVGVVFGAFAAMAQRDIKRMLGYSSINHLSYCLLALFAIALPSTTPTSQIAAETWPGVVLQMFNHGLSAAALFFFVGVLESRSGGRRGLNDFGGVRAAAPVFAGLCGIAMFSSLGLPGLNGFVGEFIIFRGVFALTPWVAAIATLALLATAIFLLTFYQRVFHGPPGAVVESGAFRDLSAREILVVAPAIALMFVLGVYPQLLLGVINRWVASQ